MSAKLETRAGARRTALVLGALVVGYALLLWTQARQIHLWTQDEEYFVQLSRLLSEHFPSAVVDLPVQPFDDRGIQRFTILLLAQERGLAACPQAAMPGVARSWPAQASSSASSP